MSYTQVINVDVTLWSSDQVRYVTDAIDQALADGGRRPAPHLTRPTDPIEDLEALDLHFRPGWSREPFIDGLRRLQATGRNQAQVTAIIEGARSNGYVVRDRAAELLGRAAGERLTGFTVRTNEITRELLAAGAIGPDAIKLLRPHYLELPGWQQAAGFFIPAYTVDPPVPVEGLDTPLHR